MKRAIIIAVAVLCLSLAAGCTFFRSAVGPNTNMTGDSWYTEVTGLGPFLPFSTSVYYCPPASGGAATCIEAEMVEEGSPGAAAPGAPPMEPAPAPAPEPEGFE